MFIFQWCPHKLLEKTFSPLVYYFVYTVYVYSSLKWEKENIIWPVQCWYSFSNTTIKMYFRLSSPLVISNCFLFKPSLYSTSDIPRSKPKTTKCYVLFSYVRHWFHPFKCINIHLLKDRSHLLYLLSILQYNKPQFRSTSWQCK